MYGDKDTGRDTHRAKRRNDTVQDRGERRREEKSRGEERREENRREETRAVNMVASRKRGITPNTPH